MKERFFCPIGRSGKGMAQSPGLNIKENRLLIAPLKEPAPNTFKRDIVLRHNANHFGAEGIVPSFDKRIY